MEAGNTGKADALRAKVNERVQLLIAAKAEITADTIAKIQQAGIEMLPVDEQQVEESEAETEKEQVDENESDSAGSEAAPTE